MKKISKKTIITVVIIVIIVFGGIFLIKKAKDKEAQTPIAKSYDVVVSTQKVSLDSVKVTLPYLAMVQNDEDVKISTKIGGRVNYITPSGSKIKKGQLIVEIDNTTIQSNINSVKSQLDAIIVGIKNMNETHKRTLELLEAEGASIEQSQKEESKLSELNSKKESLAQKLNELYNMMTYANIKSPVDGVVSKTMVNEGDIAMPGHPIANLKSENGFYLLVRVPTEMKILGIEMGNNHFEAVSLKSTFNGLAEYKAYTNLSGMTSGDRVEVNVELFNGTGILLPFDAIINRNGKSYVLVRTDNKATAQEINILESGEQGVVIKNTNLAGKEIVIAKQDILLKLLGGVSLKVKED